ncbi:glycoside hydrolase family 65 protein [Dyadobacter chenwenxiniae]|uniref:Glycoside hydrolase family 65 protein n=1 Tax=Dyadobacter chenwenxiniae TaxID=2906456 RepID=A0A9X1THC3_9BACT|nr:glycoside hydrolase family 65 protein [Dyadobacter chenwenxiniae]MCF0064962.1 glycoside hydrolase family 65 protein [Dyadobacter chenwenxiniae]UON83083.1 glycoside hydrolase family 65 protein [Dyadobacter chenwenxiniae]
MKNYITHDEWSIVENGFHAEYNEITESLMSLGNGRMGQRGNFEEHYSGKSLQGNYVAGVYFPDKTRVGWWKNGYPNYFAKVLNACNWIGIDIRIGEEVLDMNTCEIETFSRVLNMKEGVLERVATVKMAEGRRIKIHSKRFCSMADDESGAISYKLTPLNFSDYMTITPYLDGSIRNRDSNYDESFWNEVHKETGPSQGYLILETKPNPYGVELFQVATGMAFNIKLDGLETAYQPLPVEMDRYVAGTVKVEVKEGQELSVYKYGVNLSSNNYPTESLLEECKSYVSRISEKGFDHLLAAHMQAWAVKWERNDITIEGNIAAQQAIRFNIFHLGQTYTGEDERLNIGPKGFTGEKYGGVTYWDTEAYCIPFYLSTAEQKVARNLLVYRYKQLDKAIENAEKLGFSDGAALYPMVTMNGEECHNEWEITFEEIHRNGAIAYAIYDYTRYTSDESYVNDQGLEVLIAISRFWKQRINWSEEKGQYVMLGVTGPNEYENNVNNNWYTNYIACWTLRYTLEIIGKLWTQDSRKLNEIIIRTNFSLNSEMDAWKHIVENMHFPYDQIRQVYLQQQGFLDKEILTVHDIAGERPINQNWSWDRILRSCFIKQADVLQGLYFFEDEFQIADIKRNFEFYEPMTVHESSLSPCVHAILAAKIGLKEKAYEMYVRTARLDLDDYNNDTEDGLHITSMAGTWMSVVKGFAGQRVKDGMLVLNPYVPEQWNSYSFRIGFRGALLLISVSKSAVTIQNSSDKPLDIMLGSRRLFIDAFASIKA